MTNLNEGLQSPFNEMVLGSAAFLIHHSIPQRIDHTNTDFFSHQAVRTSLQQKDRLEGGICDALPQEQHPNLPKPSSLPALPCMNGPHIVGGKLSK